MYYNINIIYDVDIHEDIIYVINKKTGEKSQYSENQINKICNYMAPNQWYFNGADCSLMNYIRNYLLPYERYIEYYKENEQLINNAKNSNKQNIK